MTAESLRINESINDLLYDQYGNRGVLQGIRFFL